MTCKRILPGARRLVEGGDEALNGLCRIHGALPNGTTILEGHATVSDSSQPMTLALIENRPLGPFRYHRRRKREAYGGQCSS